MLSSCGLTLADGFSVRITVCDADASPVVEMLAQAMNLARGNSAKKTLYVFTTPRSQSPVESEDVIVCHIAPPKNRDDLVTQAMRVGLALAHDAQKRGGLLVHGGLAEFHGQGVIIAAPGGTGKSTASSRLPKPWTSLSDDAALVVRGAQGEYFAHPWPTWSRFYDNGPGGAWHTSYCVPLSAFYFLFQSPEDMLEDLNSSQAAAMLIESVEQANRIFARSLTPPETHNNHRRQFSNVCALTAHLPAYHLRLSLTGEFWRLMEGSLELSRASSSFPVNATVAASHETDTKAAPPGVAFSGNSMYPTIKEPDYLEILAYGNTLPRRGDVVYFRSPGRGLMVVHRVMAVRPDGLVTRGDNNPQNDPGIIPPGAVEGRVIAVCCADKKRGVRGGAAGMMDFFNARVLYRARWLAAGIYRLFSGSYPLTGSLRFFAPRRARFKFVFFGHMPVGHLKIFINGRCVGHYQRGVWHIAYPWRLWIDPVKLEKAAKKYEAAKTQWREARIASRLSP